MILRFVWNIRVMQMIITKTLKNICQKKRKVLIVFDDMIADLLSNI